MVVCWMSIGVILFFGDYFDDGCCVNVFWCFDMYVYVLFEILGFIECMVGGGLFIIVVLLIFIVLFMM